MPLRKLILTPFFGDLPPWFDKFKDDFDQKLAKQGYDWLMETDLEIFKERVKLKLGLKYPGTYGTGKVWDYRCAFGLLYEEELKDYDYWGHMDLDMVFGDVNQFIPDELLKQLDVYSSHNEYVCGCFSLYRNVDAVNTLFQNVKNWKNNMIHPEANGWVEMDFSRALEQSGLSYMYTFNQGNPWTAKPILEKKEGKLFQLIDTTWHEIMFFHFRHSKRWPL